jgi:hypothetical protein
LETPPETPAVPGATLTSLLISGGLVLQPTHATTATTADKNAFLRATWVEWRESPRRVSYRVDTKLEAETDRTAS